MTGNKKKAMTKRELPESLLTARYCEQRHQRTANRLIVISPMIYARARKVAERRLGIETYGDSSEVESLQ